LQQKIKELRKTLQRYNTLIMSSQYAIVAIDEEGKLILWNRGAEKIFGYSPKEILGQPVTRLMPEQYREAHHKGLQNALVHGKRSKKFILGEGLRKDGSAFPVEWSLTSWKEGGKIVLAAIGRDLSDYRRAEEMLVQSEKRYRQLCEGISDAMALVRLPDFKFSYWNKRFEKLAEQFLAKNIEEVTIQDLGQLFESDGWNKALKMLAKAAAGEFVSDSYTVELKAVDLQGKQRVLEAKSSVYKENENATGVQLLIRDITERRELEEGLRASEEKWHSLVENAPSSIMILNVQGKIEFVNRAAAGLSTEEMTGKSIYEYTPPEYRDNLRQILEQVFTEGSTSSYEAKGLFPPGAWYKTHIAPVKRDGQVVAAVLISADITKLKQAEQSLRESEERYRRLYDGITEAVAVFRLPDLKITHWNKQFEKYASQVYGKNVQDVSATDIVPSMEAGEWNRAMDALHRLLSGESVPAVYQFELRGVTGGKRVLEVKPSLYREEGQPLAIQVLIRDITEFKEAEERLKESEERYRSLFENSLEAVFTSDLKGNITAGNRALEELTGYSLEELKTMDWKKTVTPESVEPILRAYGKLLRTGEPIHNIIYETVRKDGQRRITEGSVTLLKKGGQIMGFQGVVRDITERKKAEEQLRESFINLAETVSRALESCDSYTASHQRGVAELARAVGEKMGLDQDRVLGLYIGGLLHDIGKIAVPSSILSKPGRLAEEEWALIRSHTKQGYNILKDARFPWPIAEMALYHHERLDGSGYPYGVTADSLSLEVRILAVCDVVEAMGAHRPYRPARTRREWVEEIRRGRGTKYDADVVDAILEMMERGEFKFARNGRNSGRLSATAPTPE